MNDNIIMTLIFQNDFKKIQRSHKVTFMYINQLFLKYILCLKTNLFKTFSEWLKTLAFVLIDNFCPCFIVIQLLNEMCFD